MPFYPRPEINAVTNILTFLNPKSFLQAAKLWQFMLPDAWDDKDRTLSLAASLDKIKQAKADIFSDEDTCLTATLTPVPGGLTNACFQLKTKKGAYFLRIPGKGSEEHLSRQDEAYNVQAVESLDFNIRFHFLDNQSGLYVSEFIDNPTPLTPEALAERKTLCDVAGILKTLHSHRIMFSNTLDTFTRLKTLIDKIDAYGHTWLYDRATTMSCLNQLQDICQADTRPFVPCHNDPTYLNFLYQGNRLKLLDWEYSGNNKALYDLANFARTSDLSRDNELVLLQAYFGHAPDKTLLECFDAYKKATNLWYYLWAELQIANHSQVVPLEELQDLAKLHWEMATSAETPPHRANPLTQML